MTYLSLALCFIPLVALYLCLALLVPGFKKLTGLWACVLGLLALIPAEIFLMFVGTRLPGSTLLGMLVKCILLALIEEGIKMLLLFLLPAKKTPLPVFFAYAVICGMALGCFEAFIYLVRRNVLLWRYAATLIHVLCCGLSGLFVYSVRKKNLHIAPFVFAVLFHGVYNYFAGFKDFRHYFAFAVIVIAVLECRLRYAFLKDDVEKLSVIGNDNNNIVEKGENLKMGLKDLFKGLFGRKKEDAEPSLPEQTVFGKTSNATDAAVSAAEETVEAVDEVIDSAAEIARVASDSVDEAKSELSSQYPAIDKLFDDDAPQDTVEPKTDLFTSDIDAKLAAVEEKVVSVLASSDESEKKPATRKRASTKASSSSATTKRTRKTAAEKDSEKEAPKKPGRKPGTTTKKATTAKSAAKKSASAEEKTAKTGTKKTAAKSSTAKTTKTAASKAKSASTEKKAAAKSTTTKAKSSTKTAAKKTDAAKTTKAKTATTKAAAEKKPAAKKTTTTKKTSSTTKKTTKKS